METLLDISQAVVILITLWVIYKAIRLFIDFRDYRLLAVWIAMAILLTAESLEFLHIQLGEFEDIGNHLIDILPYMLFLLYDLNREQSLNTKQNQRIQKLEEQIKFLQKSSEK